jgi:hypothetical protein
MWTPLEASLSPFKELARLNRQTVTGTGGHAVQIVLAADRCHVHQGLAGAAIDGPAIDLGFSLGGQPYDVRLLGNQYRRDGQWDFERIRSDISAGLRSGAIQSGASCVIMPGS